MKACTKCGELKSKTEFSKNKNALDGLQHSCKSCFKQYRANNKNRISEVSKAYYAENKELIDARNKNYYAKNKESLLSKQKEYASKNKTSIAKYKKNYHYSRLKKDPVYRAISSIRTRLSTFCKYVSLDKQFKTIEAIGLSQNDFKAYIESNFSDGMNWNNYGKGNDKWCIDHIKPLRLATTIDDVYLLNHYTNLQPMWNPDNSLKGGKFENYK